jgi:hypothetical protein
MSSQENFVPAAEEAHAHTFLTLAPTTSASYPTTPLTKPAAAKSPAAAAPTDAASVPAVPAVEPADQLLLKTRRSSSLDSTTSAKRRYLKLGPVHFGEGDGDWSEDVLVG